MTAKINFDEIKDKRKDRDHYFYIEDFQWILKKQNLDLSKVTRRAIRKAIRLNKAVVPIVKAMLLPYANDDQEG